MSENKEVGLESQKRYPQVRLDFSDIGDLEIPEKFTLIPKYEHVVNDLAKGTIELVNMIIEHDITTLFFLDKSARPSAWLFLKTWERVFPDTEPPAMKFINIDKKSCSIDDLQQVDKVDPIVKTKFRQS